MYFLILKLAHAHAYILLISYNTHYSYLYDLLTVLALLTSMTVVLFGYWKCGKRIPDNGKNFCFSCEE